MTLTFIYPRSLWIIDWKFLASSYFSYFNAHLEKNPVKLLKYMGNFLYARCLCVYYTLCSVDRAACNIKSGNRKVISNISNTCVQHWSEHLHNVFTHSTVYGWGVHHTILLRNFWDLHNIAMCKLHFLCVRT